MPGVITGFYGQQRSGKTLAAYLMAERYRAMGCETFSNLKVDLPGWIFIESLEQIPINYKPKNVLLDEAYYMLDSRNWKDFKEASLFFNCIGKMNINLMFTGITIDDMELRLRNQHSYVFLVKKDQPYIYYRGIDVNRKRTADFQLKMTDELFSRVHYNSNRVSSYVDMDVKKFLKAVQNDLLDEPPKANEHVEFNLLTI